MLAICFPIVLLKLIEDILNFGTNLIAPAPIFHKKAKHKSRVHSWIYRKFMDDVFDQSRYVILTAMLKA